MIVTYQDDQTGFGNRYGSNGLVPSFSGQIASIPNRTMGDVTITLEYFGDFDVGGTTEALTINIEGVTFGAYTGQQYNGAFGPASPSTVNLTIDQATWASIIADGVIDINYSVGDGFNNLSDAPGVEEFVKLTFTWDRGFVNSAPVVSAPLVDQSTDQDAAFSYTLAPNAFTDANGDTLTYAATLADGSPLPAWLSFDAATRTFSGTPGNADVGTISVKVTASDGAASAADVFDIAIGNVNDAPTAIALSAATVAENSATGTIIGQVSGIDPDAGDVLGFSLSRNPGNAFAIVDGNLVVAKGAHLDFETKATYAIVIRATDLAGESFDHAFTVNLTDVLENPSGASGNDRLTGDAGNNRIRGYGGDDSLQGKQGDDVLFGDQGNDHLRGGRGDDRLLGGNGNDLLRGGYGSDELYGGQGNNRLRGGLDADTLTGGAGADLFVFRSVGDSLPATADTITDFSRAQGDKIMLRFIDADTTAAGHQHFSFIGKAAFSNAAGELRFERSGADTLISGDIDGDGVADFAILAAGHINFRADDFVL
ncbi:putative Ig domain-containing protein [Rhizobium sp. KVB221]|uniref:Ig domain-containing protein n=1 Tax=Rhizobium setariae TaxID=2801340 RepID=A0A937CR54_9HYPH|nr:putative Ig domain-containing protein [Rhizobium setariae]MBL0373942.1 putative Ig domain-containing protein [Rhizobium setariae]